MKLKVISSEEYILITRFIHHSEALGPCMLDQSGVTIKMKLELIISLVIDDESESRKVSIFCFSKLVQTSALTTYLC